MLLFVAADAREFRGLLKFCADVSHADLPVRWARTGTLNGKRILAVSNGAGGRLAGQAVDAGRSEHALESVWNIGFCGALDKSLAIGNIFVANTIHAVAREFPSLRPITEAHYASGPLASIDHVAQTAEEKNDLRRNGAMAVEMEAGGVADRALHHELPFYCVRAVTDLAGETFACDFNAALRADGQFDTIRLLASAVRRPLSRFPELVRLQRRCDLASRNLGEFLAGCHF